MEMNEKEYTLTGLTRSDIRWIYGCVLLSNWRNYEDAAIILGQLSDVYGGLLSNEADSAELAFEFIDPNYAAMLPDANPK